MNLYRRKLLALASAGMVAPHLFAASPPKGMYRIGYLTTGSQPKGADAFLEIFKKRLHELGYVEGKNIVIAPRWADNNAGNLPGLVAELIALKPDTIVAVTPEAIIAVKQATKAIPIIMASNSDPVALKLVDSLAKPGGNVTGVAAMNVETASKSLELLHSVVPNAKRIAVLMRESEQHKRQLSALEPAAAKFRLTILPTMASSPEEIKTAFMSMAKSKAQAMMQFALPLYTSQKENIVAYAANAKLPAIYSIKEYVKAGGLMSYGPNVTERFRLAADYVDKILKGANPRDLPVQQPTKYELAINLKTAKALAITFPQDVLLLADEVIE